MNKILMLPLLIVPLALGACESGGVSAGFAQKVWGHADGTPSAKTPEQKAKLAAAIHECRAPVEYIKNGSSLMSAMEPCMAQKGYVITTTSEARRVTVVAN